MSPVCVRCGWLPGAHKMKPVDPLPPGQRPPPKLPDRECCISTCPGYLAPESKESLRAALDDELAERW